MGYRRGGGDLRTGRRYMDGSDNFNFASAVGLSLPTLLPDSTVSVAKPAERVFNPVGYLLESTFSHEVHSNFSIKPPWGLVVCMLSRWGLIRERGLFKIQSGRRAK